MKIKNSFLLIEEQAPKILQDDTLERYKFEANSFPTKELAFELTSPIPKVEKFILTSDGDEEGVLATMDEVPKQNSQTLKTEQRVLFLFGRHNQCSLLTWSSSLSTLDMQRQKIKTHCLL